MNLLFLLGILPYAAVIAYMARRGWKVFGPYCKHRWLYIVPVVLLSVFPVFSELDMIFRFALPWKQPVVAAGFVVAAFLLYLLLLLCAFDLVRLVVRLVRGIIRREGVGGRKRAAPKLRVAAGVAILAASLAVCALGLVQANQTQITRIEKTIEGQAGGRVRIAAVSDLHYGAPGSVADLQKLASELNALAPDVVVLAGDVFDNKVANLDREAFCNAFAQVEAEYGVFAVTGNHEYGANYQSEIREFYRGSGVRLLEDEAVEVAGRLILIGRNDYLLEKGGLGRKAILELMGETNLPAVVIDHQPQTYREAEGAGAVLQISGHTHNGQIWPGDLAVALFNRVLYQAPSIGRSDSGEFTLFITRGYGTWGFPMRTTGSAEIACINLSFTP